MQSSNLNLQPLQESLERSAPEWFREHLHFFVDVIATELENNTSLGLEVDQHAIGDTLFAYGLLYGSLLSAYGVGMNDAVREHVLNVLPELAKAAREKAEEVAIDEALMDQHDQGKMV